MENKLIEILSLKPEKKQSDFPDILNAILANIKKFDFDDDYLQEGKIEIVSASECTYYTSLLENFTETRSINKIRVPNDSGVLIGNKDVLQFNVWDYSLKFENDFKNFVDTYEIEESHFASGCPTCKQFGKIRCSRCNGSGDITCKSCSGRGENQCGNCYGKGETKCFWCSGKGTKESGYGEKKIIERCNSCSGRGVNPCTRCSNGYITCYNCSGSGKESCYNCSGSGEVICVECDGFKTLDNYYEVTSHFINISQNIYLNNPYSGFDSLKAKNASFNIQKIIFDLREERFKEDYFKSINSSPFYNQITTFFSFINDNNTKLIASRIIFLENKYNEVVFKFYGEVYKIYFDKNFDKSYYDGKKPSDQYELDLLKKVLSSTINDELEISKKTFEKLLKYDFIDICESQMISNIEDTLKIYNSVDNYSNKKFTVSEKILKTVNKSKVSENDFLKIKSKLLFVYSLITFCIGLIGLFLIGLCLNGFSLELLAFHTFIAVTFLIISLVLNIYIRNLYFSIFFIFTGLFIHSIILYKFKLDVSKDVNSFNKEYVNNFKIVQDRYNNFIINKKNYLTNDFFKGSYEANVKSGNQIFILEKQIKPIRIYKLYIEKGSKYYTWKNQYYQQIMMVGPIWRHNSKPILVTANKRIYIKDYIYSFDYIYNEDARDFGTHIPIKHSGKKLLEIKGIYYFTPSVKFNSKIIIEMKNSKLRLMVPYKLIKVDDSEKDTLIVFSFVKNEIGWINSNSFESHKGEVNKNRFNEIFKEKECKKIDDKPQLMNFEKFGLKYFKKYFYQHYFL